MFYQIIILFLLTNISFGQWSGARGKMPAIGVIRGSVTDSTSGQPLEYTSISLVNMRSNEVVTGALSDKTGNFNIREIPLGRYRAVVEFIGYAAKEISPIPGISEIRVSAGHRGKGREVGMAKILL